ncbi:hypothetical protein C8054_10385 [Micromonospora sp. RP3T]|nr:hypothetical protein C8054_10385 [Micromonospora sp. RP3T]
MDDRDEIVAARRALGRRLAHLRRAAGLTQHRLAPLVRYARSSIASTETGRQHPDRAFWCRCDTVLRTGGTLTADYDRIAELGLRRRRVGTERPAGAGRGELGGRVAVHLSGLLATLARDLRAFRAARAYATEAFDLATAHLRVDDLEQATGLAVRALALTADRGVESVRRRARQLLDAAGPSGHHSGPWPVAEPLDDRRPAGGASRSRARPPT